MREFNDSCGRLQIQTIMDADSSPLFWVERAGLPILVILCVIGNCLNIILMVGEKPKVQSTHMVSKSTKVFLLGMAISDILLLSFQVPTYVAIYIQEIPFFDNSTVANGFKQFYGVQSWGSEAFLQWSDWILIAFSIDRLKAFHHIAQSFRFKHDLVESSCCNTAVADKHETKPGERPGIVVVARISSSSTNSPDASTRHGFRRSTSILLVVVLLFGALIFTMEYGVFWFYYRTHDPGNGQRFYTYRPAWLSDWSFYQTICDVTMTVAKFSVLALVNIHLIFIVVSQHRAGLSITADNRRRQSKEKTGTNLLVGCLLVYFFTHFPYVVYQCLRLAAAPPYCLIQLPVDTILLARPMIKMVLYSNYSLNFLLYFALSRKFRDEFHLLPQRFQALRRRWQFNIRNQCCSAWRSCGLHRGRFETMTSTTSTETTVTLADATL